jgi:hypothetical protein
MEKRFGLKKFGNQLWTRETARPIRTRLSDMLETMRVGDVLVVDMSGVDIFDFSFASELFGKALSRLGVDYPGRFVITEGLTESARENLNQALEVSNLIMIERQGHELRLLKSTSLTAIRSWESWKLGKQYRPPPLARSWTSAQLR